jgi:glycosyltransferase involved in cell wall biosynthesis
MRSEKIANSTSRLTGSQAEVHISNKTEHLLIGRPPGQIAEVLQDNYHYLDVPLTGPLKGELITGKEKSGVGEAYPSDIRVVRLPRILGIFKFVPVLYDLLRSMWLLGSADQRTCILIDGGQRFGILTCILNSFMPIRRRKIVLWEAYIPTGKLKRWLAHQMILGSSLTVVYSRWQLNIQAKLLNVPGTKFIFMPYKANHSKSPPITLQIGGYVFSGGNSRRDYKTLFEAVRDTGIPVVVSATQPKVYADLDVPENVILLAAREPAFARLMAASRFVIIPIVPGLVRGAGETSVCNAMWHGRPVICADNISAFEYIEDGVTGYVTPAGDVARLRERVIELWNQPEKAAEMGRAAYQAAAANFTDEHFSRRLRALAAIVAMSR